MTLWEIRGLINDEYVVSEQAWSRDAAYARGRTLLLDELYAQHGEAADVEVIPVELARTVHPPVLPRREKHAD